ncbi:MAG: zinc-dependent alcohol dehydrogenase family protein [Planctomycetaceae bacterium]
MKAFQVQSSQGIDALQCIELPEPSPKHGELKIRMHAASLNYRDLGILQGGYFRNDTQPVIPLSDGAGEVVEIGEGVTRFRIGDRVSPIFVRDWIAGPPSDAALRSGLGGGIDGVLAEYIVAPEQSVVAIPSSLSYAEAATLPCAGVTAWHALNESSGFCSGQTVLLLGTGGVSIFALQLAKTAGARTVITSSNDEKLSRAKGLGADETVNYKRIPDWDKVVLRLTGGEGVDHVVEVGGPGTLERSLRSTKVGGQVHLIGVLDSPTSKVSPLISVFNLLTIRGIYVGSRVMHERLLAAITATNLKPVIDRSFAFADAREAYGWFATQQHFGKVVIEFA